MFLYKSILVPEERLRAEKLRAAHRTHRGTWPWQGFYPTSGEDCLGRVPPSAGLPRRAGRADP